MILQIVRATPDSSAKQGEAIKSGSVIRLQHMTTRKWLHSHLHTSPLSGNLEVSKKSFSSDVCISRNVLIQLAHATIWS